MRAAGWPDTRARMATDDLKALIDQWHQAMRRCSYLEAMREATPPSATADALDEQIAEAAAEVERLRRAVLGEDRQVPPSAC